MPCFSPLKGYYSADKNRSGKRSIVFNAQHSFSGVPVPIPCGQCTGCRLEKSRIWALRCMNEKRMHSESSFLTLTYDDKHLPAGGTLVKRDLQLFMKRLRKERGNGLRFYACGEYGALNYRPHYHVLLFNLDFPDKKFLQENKRGEPLFRSESLYRLWPFGLNAVGAVTFDSCAYVARYIMDKITGPLALKHYGDRVPEYTVMSRRPGIGHSYYMKYAHEIYAHDNLIMNGKKVHPPRFYDDRFRMVDSQFMDELKVARRRNAIEKSRADNTPERRRVREQFELKRLALSKRNVT